MYNVDGSLAIDKLDYWTMSSTLASQQGRAGLFVCVKNTLHGLYGGDMKGSFQDIACSCQTLLTTLS